MFTALAQTTDQPNDPHSPAPAKQPSAKSPQLVKKSKQHSVGDIQFATPNSADDLELAATCVMQARSSGLSNRPMWDAAATTYCAIVLQEKVSRSTKAYSGGLNHGFVVLETFLMCLTLVVLDLCLLHNRSCNR